MLCSGCPIKRHAFAELLRLSSCLPAVPAKFHPKPAKFHPKPAKFHPKRGLRRTGGASRRGAPHLRAPPAPDDGNAAVSAGFFFGLLPLSLTPFLFSLGRCVLGFRAPWVSLCPQKGVHSKLRLSSKIDRILAGASKGTKNAKNGSNHRHRAGVPKCGCSISPDQHCGFVGS